MSNTRYTYEVICIDDRSEDETPDVIRKFIKKNKRWKGYFHNENKGRGATVTEGILKSKGKVVGYIDVDLEISPLYIPEFVASIKQGADVVIATRVYKIEPSNIIRAISSILYVKISQLSLGHKYKDTEAGYKFFNRKKITPLLKKIKSPHWFFDTEIVLRSAKRRLKIVEITVLFLRRKDKQSTVRLIPDTLDYLKSVWKFREELRL